MKIYAIGDLHLSHGMDKPMDVFGDHWKEHITQIESAWKARVREEDVVLIPGDLSWAMRLEEALVDLKWLEDLPGYKICIRGNHDYWWDRPGKLNRSFKHIYFLQNKACKVDEVAICGTRGWNLPIGDHFTEEDAKIFQRERLRLELSLEDGLKQGAKELWVMLHYPPCLNKKVPSPYEDLFEKYKVKKVIYGHIHDEVSWQEALIGMQNGRDYYLVAADYLQFKPLEIKK